MRIPFTIEQFLEVFARFNEAIWPSQLGAYALGLATVVLALRGGPLARRAVPGLLMGAWAFVGTAYHLIYFSPLNPAAVVFGAAFIVQALLFAEAALRQRLVFGFSRSVRTLVGLAFVAYAAVAYPLLAASWGHAYPRMPMFGVTPCPTAIFTFGVLLLAREPVPVRLLVIPFLWSLVGASAALQLGIREDLGLVVAGVVGTALLAWPRTRAARPA